MPEARRGFVFGVLAYAFWGLFPLYWPLLPLLFFAGAASRLPLSTLGVLQYLTPTLQLLIGVYVQHEPMPVSRLIGFILVWSALITLTADGWRHRSRPVREPRPIPEPVTADLA